MLDTAIKNRVLNEMAILIEKNKESIFQANQKDIDSFDLDDQAMYDRLKIDHHKIDEMIGALHEVAQKEDPVNIELSTFVHQNGMRVVNKSASFGTILIIYESRPDVTIEAAALSFKSGNKTLLKGGKEARHSCIELVNCWKTALINQGLSPDLVTYLNLPRAETQAYLKNPSEKVDLIVPRGGESLIEFAKTHAAAPVLVSGRGNNFVYVDKEANWDLVLPIVIHSKTGKISACNALDKVLIDASLENLKGRITELYHALCDAQVDVIVDPSIASLDLIGDTSILDEESWYQEYLSMKIGLGLVSDTAEAIQIINKYSGGHSISILTENTDTAQIFMNGVDCAAVYHNASTRFTDGGAFGMGAELAISTDKLHHRGPLGLQHLVTNKYFVYGSGQIRE